jgi:hypothetical protein
MRLTTGPGQAGQVIAIELVPLCTMRIQAKPPVEVGAGPAGTRMVFEEPGVEVHGTACAGSWRDPLVTACSSARRGRERSTSA